MRAVVEQGTGRKARINGQVVAGKTGTSQDYRDAWFVGYTAHMVAGVWMGNDDNSVTERVTGGNLPAIVWNRVMTAAHNGLSRVDLPGESTLYGPGELPVAYDSGGVMDMLQEMFGGRRNGGELEADLPRGSNANREIRQQRIRQRQQDLLNNR